MVKKLYPISPCPWCKQTPRFVMYLEQKTWLPQFRCENSLCKVNPQSKYVPVRNTSKKNCERFQQKIEKMINQWNENNPVPAYEGLEFDFDDIIQKENERCVK